MKLKFTRNTFISYSLIVMIFSSFLSLHTTGITKKFFSNFDEIFAIIMLLYYIKIRKHTKFQKKILFLQFCFIVIGLIGSIINKYQPINYVTKDIINCTKFVAVLLGITSLYQVKNSNEIITIFQKTSKKLIIIFFVMTILDLIFKPSFFVHTSKKFSIYELSLIYYHPAILAQVLILFISILSFKTSVVKNKKIYIGLCMIMLILTFVTKAIGFAFVYLFITNYKKILENKMISFFIIVIATCGLLFIASDSIKTYYGSMEDTARGRLTIGSIKVAKKYFPFGGGLGTYGSSAAAENYSPIYKELGFEKVYGLGYITTKYATDTFWPIIIGEYGFIGLFVYVTLVLKLIKETVKLIKKQAEKFIPCISLLVYLLICSTSSTSFFNPISVVYAIIIGICIADSEKYKKQYRKGEIYGNNNFI